MQILQMRVELFHVESRTDITKLLLIFACLMTDLNAILAFVQCSTYSAVSTQQHRTL